MRNKLVLHPLHQRRAAVPEAGDQLDGVGDQVEKDSPLCEIHARSQEDADRAEAAIRAAITIGPEAVGPLKDYIALVTKEGVCWTEDRS